MLLSERASVYEDEGKFQEAIADYRRAIETENNSDDAGDPYFYSAYYLGRDKYLANIENADVDLASFVNDQSHDPNDSTYRIYFTNAALWLHLARAQKGIDDAAELAQRFPGQDMTVWPSPILALYIGKTTATKALAAAPKNIDGQCFADYWVGEYDLMEGIAPPAGHPEMTKQGRDLLHKVVKVCPSDSEWHWYAATSLKWKWGP